MEKRASHQRFIVFHKAALIKTVYIFLLIIPFINGCDYMNEFQGARQTPAIRLTPIVTSAIPKLTRTPSNYSIPTSTETLTSSLESTSTWTPMPTLSLETRREAVIQLLNSNGGCNFPCWWGLRQGDSIEKAAALSTTLGEPLRPFGWQKSYYSLSLREHNTSDLSIIIDEDKNNNIKRIVINLYQPSLFREYYPAFEERFSISGILAKYGRPNEVLFASAPLVEPGPIREYVIFIIYEEQDFGIAYVGNVGIDDPVKVCSIEISNHSLTEINLYLNEPRENLKELNQRFLNDLQPLGEVTSIDVGTFYEAYSKPDSNICIESPVDRWQ